MFFIWVHAESICNFLGDDDGDDDYDDDYDDDNNKYKEKWRHSFNKHNYHHFRSCVFRFEEIHSIRIANSSGSQYERSAHELFRYYARSTEANHKGNDIPNPVDPEQCVVK